MLIIEVSWMSESGYSDIELLEYIDEHFNEIECELEKSIRNPKSVIIIFVWTATW